MIRIREGRVTEINATYPGVTELTVEIDGCGRFRAINYDHLTGPVRVGDGVLLNTTAVHKKLGTGGWHFVMANTSNPSLDPPEAGHIMKLRYTPGQIKVLSVEEPESPASDILRTADSLAGGVVVVGELHSMLAPVCAVLAASTAGRCRVVYVMTDGAALPIYFSRLVRELRAAGLISATVTCGHAFGGDYEAVNIYTGLLAARKVARADVIVVTMGPGVVGTGSRFGFTGVEQGEIINAVNVLEGQPVAVPRISFADPRERHRGLSHHTATALGVVALTRCTVTVPLMEEEKERVVWRQIEEAGITRRHRVVRVDGSPVFEALKKYDVSVTTMGRTPDQDREFFLAAGAAGIWAAGLVAEKI